MSKISVKALAVFRHLNKYRLETGFSMLEAVVVVGVLLALAVGGFTAYGPITENAKKAKVKSAASEIYTAITVASFDGDSTTSPQDTIDAYNNSTDRIKVELLDPVAGTPAMSTAVAMSAAAADFCVQATDLKSPHIKARVGTCTDVADDTAPDNGDGSSPGVTFVRIPETPSASPQGIRYVNAVLAEEASVTYLGQDWDMIYASSERAEREAAYNELTHFDAFVYDTDPHYRIDSGLPELAADFQSKLAAFESDPTVAKQQAMVTAHRTLFATAVANPIPLSERSLVPAPSNPEKFQGVTVTAGTDVPVVVRVAIPTSLYKPEWTIGAGWHDGLILGANTVGVDGDYTYWDVTLTSSTYVTDPDGTITGSVWEAGVYNVFLTATDNLGVSRSMDFRITVE